MPIKKILQKKKMYVQNTGSQKMSQNKYLLPPLLLITFLYLLSHLVLRDSWKGPPRSSADDLPQPLSLSPLK